MRAVLLTLIICAAAPQARAQTIATFNFPRVGSIEIELFDDKPITVSNFLKYASSGRYENQFIQRWVTNFVIQGGGYRVDTSNPEQYTITPVQVYGTITNEAHVGTFRSNTYGTIAMARAPGQTNSANSQWFINLKDNSGLDAIDGGFTVFGRLLSGSTVLNKFIPPPPTHGIYINDTIIPSPMAVLAATNLTWDDIVYVDLSFRRDMNLRVARANESHKVSWLSVANVTNLVETSTTLTNWTTLTNLVGSGRPTEITDTSADPYRFFRVKLLY